MTAKKWILNDLGWKLAALALASVLWLTTVGEPDVATSINAPLQLLNAPPDLEISSNTPGQIRLDVRGRSGRMSPQDLAPVAVTVDLSDARPGERTIPIDASNVKLPDGVMLERARPAELELRLEPRVRREVPVILRIGMPPAPGWEVVSTEIVPASLKVSGAESHMRNVKEAETEAVDLSQLQGDATLTAHAFISDAAVRFDGGSRVSVQVKLRRKGQ